MSGRKRVAKPVEQARVNFFKVLKKKTIKNEKKIRVRH